jgi:hypothetical protein
MSQFYAQATDEWRCRWSSMAQRPITITGLTLDGKVRAYEGIVQAIETGHALYVAHPLRVTMPDSNRDTASDSNQDTANFELAERGRAPRPVAQRPRWSR